MDFKKRNEITEKTFGFFVKEKREKMGMSARDLAKKMEISAVYLCDIESGNRPAPRKDDVLLRLNQALCLNEDEAQYLQKAALASRTEDIDIYLKENPRVCVALRMAQELSNEAITEDVKKEWEDFIERLVEMNSQNENSGSND